MSFPGRRLFGRAIALAALACGCGDASATSGGAGGLDASTWDGASTVDASSPADAATDANTGTDGGLVAPDASPGSACGYQGKGKTLHVATDIDVCLAPVVCTSETCPPPLGTCVGGVCQFKNGYLGLQTQPEAWATYYCELSTGGCHGVTQIEYPEITAGKIAQAQGLPLCASANGATTCVGIAASSAMVVGNSQVAIDPATNTTVKDWGLGLTEASGLCYELVGPGGTVLVALTDRCGGYCKCNGSGYQECGPCVSAPDMEPNCACVGAVPGVATNCCGRGCATTLQDCDWCASNNHPHFDLDTAAFNHLCGADAANGSCRISKAKFVACAAPNAGWPPH
jgi:hypothetical protein